MSSSPATVDEIVLSASGGCDVAARAMFGEFALYCDGKLVALICDDRLYVKPTADGLAHVGEAEMAPPYAGAKPSMLIPSERWRDGQWLSVLVRITADALPAPKPKKPRK